eukprot:scaffold80917_cov63-Phaeocystis_antarctica.AAC.5
MATLAGESATSQLPVVCPQRALRLVQSGCLCPVTVDHGTRTGVHPHAGACRLGGIGRWVVGGWVGR